MIYLQLLTLLDFSQKWFKSLFSIRMTIQNFTRKCLLIHLLVHTLCDSLSLACMGCLKTSLWMMSRISSRKWDLKTLELLSKRYFDILMKKHEINNIFWDVSFKRCGLRTSLNSALLSSMEPVLRFSMTFLSLRLTWNQFKLSTIPSETVIAAQLQKLQLLENSSLLQWDTSTLIPKLS